MSRVMSDDFVLEGIKEGLRARYKQTWTNFKAFSSTANTFEDDIAEEEVFITYFRHLRTEKKAASSTLWTTYSILNTFVKGKYGRRLQDFPRITTLLKSYDINTKKKAAIFEVDDLVTQGCSFAPMLPHPMVETNNVKTLD